MSALFHFPYRVRAGDAAQATDKAKAQARSEGWTIKTVARVEQSSNGDWIVTLAVRAADRVAG